MLSFYFDARFFGIEPFPFKLTNIFIHILAGFCLWLMTHRLLRLMSQREARLTPAVINGLSFTAAALWLAHPLNLTAVLYVVQRETALSAIFTALAIWTYLLGRQKQLEGRGTAWLFLWLLTPLFTFVGLLCKENAALVPVFLFVIEFTLLDFGDKIRRWNPQVAIFFAAFLLIPALVITGLLLSGSPFLVGGYAIRNFTLGERLLTEARILFDYLHWTFLPNLHQMGLYHDDVVVSHGLLRPPTTLLSLLGLAIMLGFAILAQRSRWRWLSFAILWFLGGQLMESSIIPLELMFEHRNYLPLFGLLLGVTVQVWFWLEAAHKRKLGIGIATLAIAMFSLLTAIRADSWNSPLSFAVSEVVHHPRSQRANYELGILYVFMALHGSPDMAPKAEQAMLQARSLDPDGLAEDMALAILYTKLGQQDKAQDYLTDAALRAQSVNPSVNTQVALQSLNNYPELASQYPASTITDLFKTVMSSPRVRSNACYAADIWNTYGIYLQQAGKLTESTRVTQQALALCPANVQIRLNYANHLLQADDFLAAQQQLQIVIKANHFGKYSLAILQLTQAMDAAETQYNLNLPPSK